LAETLRAAEARFQAADEVLQELSQLTDILTQAALESQGFFQHNRGAWRRKRRVSNNPGRIVATWLQVHQADLDVAGCLKANQSTSKFSVQAHRRLDQSHRRYLASVKQLALVRTLLKPTPSILDLAMRPIPETDVKGAKERERNRAVSEGVPVFN
jgi:hypothetical protein